MGIFQRLRAAVARSPTAAQVKMVTETGNGLYVYDGNLYKSDIVRACIRPKIKAVGKAMPRHIRTTIGPDGKTNTQTNPDPYIRLLLEEPNQYMTWQMYAEKMETQLILNNNAFALIQRDDNGFPVALFPIVASSVQALYNKAGELLLQFWLPNGSTWTFAYTDVIHLRNDYNENDVFGTPPGPALQSVMEVIGTTDRSIINAVRNGAVIRWLLKFTSSSMRPEDIKKQTKDFADAFLDNNNSTGVAGTDVKADAVQLEPHDYVPNALQSQNNITRLYSFFNTNEKIVKSSFSENEWISYYEAQVEPDLLQIAAEHTRKLWNRRQRAFGNKLYLESSNLQYASMSTKLSLKSMVDRGAMLPNEWRAVFGLAPVAGGDEPIRRLDTAPVKQTKSGGETE